MGWLKNIYEFVGTPYPRLSLFIVTVLGAISAYSIWSFTAKQVAKDHQTSIAPSQMSGPASTSGNKSPAVTGNGNTFKYDQSVSPKDKPPPKKE